MNIRLNFRSALALALLLALAACASTPRRNLAMEEARDSRQRAQSNPDLRRYAGEELAQADAEFAAAERAWSARQPTSRVDHLAYMAARRYAIAQATAQSRASEAVIEGAAAERDRLRLSMRTREVDRALRDSERSRVEAGSARRDAEVARSEIASLEAELSSLNAQRTERGLVVTLGDVLFDTGRSEIRPEGDANLRRIAQVLLEHPAYRAVIEGHTDNIGSASANFLLSERRAVSVMRALLAFGAPAAQMVSRGRGQEAPSASNDSASGRQMNRRVEVVFSLSEPAVARQ